MRILIYIPITPILMENVGRSWSGLAIQLLAATFTSRVRLSMDDDRSASPSTFVTDRSMVPRAATHNPVSPQTPHCPHTITPLSPTGQWFLQQQDTTWSAPKHHTVLTPFHLCHRQVNGSYSSNTQPGQPPNTTRSSHPSRGHRICLMCVHNKYVAESLNCHTMCMWMEILCRCIVA